MFWKRAAKKGIGKTLTRSMKKAHTSGTRMNAMRDTLPLEMAGFSVEQFTGFEYIGLV
jgi:hypothetical protein